MRKKAENRIKIDYSKIQPMDRVDCAGVGPTANLIRTVSAGKNYKLAYGVAVHTAIAVDIDGQKMLIEMGPRGIQHSTFLDYEYAWSRRWIIGIYRHPAFKDKKLAKEAQAGLIHRWRQHEELVKRSPYGWTDLLKFVIPWWPNSKRVTICSELYVEATRKWIGDYKEGKLYSPYDLQKMRMFCDTRAITERK